MYQALYRKWRPKDFDDVVGQEHITETLKNQVMTGRLSHAYLFIGTRGTGKTTCAKILAKAVNCESPVNGSPCNKCKSCLGIDSGSVMDVVELDAASNNGVDNVRALRDEAIYSPAQVKKRIYIVDEVHMLSTSAFNALLKILEEPPSHLMFILATTELHKIPATILSRCQRYSFRRITPERIADRLSYIASREGFELKKDAADLLSRLADGSMRDALSLLDQCSGASVIDTERIYSAMGLAGSHRTVQLLDAVASGNTSAALSIFSALWIDGKNPATLLDELSVLMRDILMTSVAPKGGSELLSGGYDSSALSELSAKFTSAELLRGLDVIQEYLSGMRDAVNPRILAELCLISLCEPQLSDGLPELNARVTRLESAVTGGAVVPAAAIQVQSPSETAPHPENDVRDIPPWEEPAPPIQAKPSAADKAPVAAAPPKAEMSDPSPADEAHTSSCVSGDVWQDILSALRGQIPVGAYSIISDSFHADGSLSGNVLTVSVKSKFAQSMIDKPEITDKLRAVGSSTVGIPVGVRVVMDDGSGKPDGSKIAALGRFGNVKFE